jgi:surface polysaccharide O-acyltransferase-like enzyme
MVLNKRIESLDILRGIALMFLILFHSSIYNYANINKIDFSNPPIIVVLMSFMAIWGGIFIIYSMVANTIMLLRRSEKFVNFKIFFYSIIAGITYIFFHYILNIILGRWDNDFVNNNPNLTIVANSLRNTNINFPNITKFFEGSSLSTIALNLVILSIVLFLLFRRNGIEKEKRNYLILGISGILIMVLSFVRVPIFYLFTQAIEMKNYLLATLYTFAIANPYPLLPYLAYGIFGAMIGIMIYKGRNKLLKIIVIPLGVLFITYGLFGIMNFEKTISTPDYFWYFKTNFELGLFMLLLVFSVLFLESKSNLLNKLSVIKWFSRVSLTIYMLETTTSEIFRITLFRIWPSWNQTINGCLLFGLLNIILWIVILFFWKKINFKYSLEYYWVIFFDKIGRGSTKMDFYHNIESKS